MKRIESIAALEALYAAPSERAQRKVTAALGPRHRAWIEAAPFCALATAGPQGMDVSPRGAAAPVATVLSPTRIALPDLPGNNRLDSLRNLVADGRAALMFLIPGVAEVMRMNGTGFVTDDADLRESLRRGGARPAAAVVFDIAEVYVHCPKAIRFAALWEGASPAADPGAVPGLAELLEEALSAAPSGGS